MNTLKINFIFSNQYLQKDTEELDIGTRTRHCLERYQIRTIGDLLDNYTQLKYITGFGVKCFKEINRALLELQMEYMEQKTEKDKGKYLIRFLELNQDVYEKLGI